MDARDTYNVVLHPYNVYQYTAQLFVPTFYFWLAERSRIVGIKLHPR